MSELDQPRAEKPDESRNTDQFPTVSVENSELPNELRRIHEVGEVEKGLRMSPRVVTAEYRQPDSGDKKANTECEDFVLRGTDFGGVFDGMGGHSGGNEASKAAAKYIASKIDGMPEGISPEEAAKWMNELMKHASANVAEKVGGDSGSTGTVFKIIDHEGQKFMIIAQMGDSAAFIARDQDVQKLTASQGIFGEYPDENNIKIYDALDSVQSKDDIEKEAKKLGIHEFELKSHYRARNVVSGALGRSDTPLVYIVGLQPGDRIAFLSDGVTDPLSSSEIANGLLNQNPADVLTDAAIQINKKNSFRAKPDDKGLLVVDIDGNFQASNMPLPKQWEYYRDYPDKSFRLNSSIPDSETDDHDRETAEIPVANLEEEAPKIPKPLQVENPVDGKWEGKRIVYSEDLLSRSEAIANIDGAEFKYKVSHSSQQTDGQDRVDIRSSWSPVVDRVTDKGMVYSKDEAGNDIYIGRLKKDENGVSIFFPVNNEIMTNTNMKDAFDQLNADNNQKDQKKSFLSRFFKGKS